MPRPYAPESCRPARPRRGGIAPGRGGLRVTHPGGTSPARRRVAGGARHCAGRCGAPQSGQAVEQGPLAAGLQRQDFRREALRLLAQLRHGRLLPEPGLAGGSEQVESLDPAVGSDGRAVPGRRVSEPERIGRQQPVGDHLPVQIRLMQAKARARAVDDPVEAVVTGAVRAAERTVDEDRLVGRQSPGDAACRNGESSGALQPGNRARRSGRQAMAVHFPERPDVAQEARALLIGQCLPQVGREQPQRIEHRVPAHVSRAGLANGAADGSHGRRHAARSSGGAQRPPDVRRQPGCLGGMRARQQAAARHRVHGADVALPMQRHHDVDHRQPRAEDQHPVRRPDVFYPAPVPRIPHVTRRIRDAPQRKRVCRSRMARGQDDGIRAQRRPVLERHVEGAGAAHDRYGAHLRVCPEPDARLPDGVDRLDEGILEVVTVNRAGNEHRIRRLYAALLEPSREAIGGVGEQAHRAGPRVQDVLIGGRAVGDAATKPLARFDQRHGERPHAAPDEVYGKRRSAETAADDDGVISLLHGFSSHDGARNVRRGAKGYRLMVTLSVAGRSPSGDKSMARAVPWH